MYDQIKTQLDTIAELSDEQVAELQADIISQFEMVEGEDPTPETVDAMTSLADSLDIVRDELSRRETQAAELAAKAAEAAARVKGEGDAAEEEMADNTEDEPMTEEEEEAPMEDAPTTEAASEEELTTEEAAVEETAADEAGMDSEKETEEESTEEMGYDKSEEEDEDKDEMSEASTDDAAEASTDQEDGSELSTESEKVEESTAAEAATEEVAEAAVETEVEAEAAAEEETAEAVTEVATEASAEEEVVESTDSAAELSAEEEVTEVAETEAELSTEETAEAVSEVAEGSEASTEEITELSNTTEEVEEGQATVTAAAEENFEAPVDRRPVVQVTEAPVAITAGADIPGYTAGTEMKDMNEVATAMEKRLHSLRRVNGGDGEQHIVASFSTQYPEERFLGTDPLENQAKIDAVVGQDALVASGGHAAPVEVQYDIYNIGSTTVRPVRDALPRFQADRGGIRFVTPPQFADGTYANAVGIWTAANDAAQSPDPAAKTSYTVTAAAEQTVQTDAITLQMQFGNLMTRAYPELIARHNELGLVQHAREAEANLLSKIGAASTAVTTSSLIGFGRDFLVQLRRAATGYRSRHRLSPDARLKAIIPSWVYDAMAADLTLSMPGDGTLAVSQSEINGYLATVNVDLVPTLDGNPFGAQASGAINEFPDSFDWYLFAEGSFLFLDGGTLDLGIIRDSSLVGTNDYKMFIETFENVAFVGVESLKVTSTISVNGVAAALRDTTGGATAAAIEL